VGAHLDFDMVVGDDADGPLTLERALGPYAASHFTPAVPAPAPVTVQDDEE
jgi:hypothetical protein